VKRVGLLIKTQNVFAPVSITLFAEGVYKVMRVSALPWVIGEEDFRKPEVQLDPRALPGLKFVNASAFSSSRALERLFQNPPGFLEKRFEF
jgi:hypothetical protein